MKRRVLFELARNKKLLTKAQQEADKFCASGLSHENVKDLKFIRACVDESLRKYPVGPVIFRQCTKDYKIPETNLTIPAGTPIYIPALGLHRDPDIYENPLEFKPERFLNSSQGDGTSPGLFYIPFGDGLRNCIGKPLAQITTVVGLAKVLSIFNFDLHDPTMADEELEFHPTQFILTSKKLIELRVSFREPKQYESIV